MLSQKIYYFYLYGVHFLLYSNLRKNSNFFLGLNQKIKCFAVVGIVSFAMLTMPLAFRAEAQAATATGTIAVSALVVATCVITTTPVAFGSYTGVQATTTATITPTCTATTPYTITLGAGAATGATTSTRAMTEPASATLAYGLFHDAAYTQNWGILPGDNFSGVATGLAQPLTVYARVLAGLYPNPGAFTDTVAVTLNY